MVDKLRVSLRLLLKNPGFTAIAVIPLALGIGATAAVERRSVVQDHEVLAEALRHSRGSIALADAKGALRLQESSGAILRVGHEVATRASLDREQHMIQAINRGIGTCERLGGDHAFLVSDRLRPDQHHAVHEVLASRDWAVLTSVYNHLTTIGCFRSENISRASSSGAHNLDPRR